VFVEAVGTELAGLEAGALGGLDPMCEPAGPRSGLSRANSCPAPGTGGSPPATAVGLPGGGRAEGVQGARGPHRRLADGWEGELDPHCTANVPGRRAPRRVEEDPRGLAESRGVEGPEGAGGAVPGVAGSRALQRVRRGTPCGQAADGVEEGAEKRRGIRGRVTIVAGRPAAPIHRGSRGSPRVRGFGGRIRAAIPFLTGGGLNRWIRRRLQDPRGRVRAIEGYRARSGRSGAAPTSA